jgi:SAM-dependent methyltransferase
VADAAHLPYEDAALDMVSCSFGLSHMENPQAAVNEAFRVLKAGGRFAFTLWFDAENGAELFAIGRDALTRYATQTVELPSAWTQLRFADPQACETIVNRAGFKLLAFLRLPIIIRSTSAQALLDILDKLSVRTRIVLDSQPLAAQQRIYEYSLSEIEARQVAGQITLGAPALLTVVEKPEREA